MDGWDDHGPDDPRRIHAPEVHRALTGACASVRAAVGDDGELLELARLRVAALLDDGAELDAPPWGDLGPARAAELSSWPTASCFDERCRAAMALTEQFVLDVTGVAEGPLGPASAALGAAVLPVVQGVYLLDVGQRVAVGLSRVFGSDPSSAEWAWPDPSAPVPADPMAAIDELMRSTARLQTLDPVLKELVRLRGARHHQCRRCQSVRAVAALRAGADEALLGAVDPDAVADLPEATQAALAFTDAVMTGPGHVPDELAARVRAALRPAEVVELACYLMRNAANKIAVAFAADAAIVEEGFEYQVIESDGDTVTVDAPA